jgi:hypothetical protein
MRRIVSAMVLAAAACAQPTARGGDRPPPVATAVADAAVAAVEPPAAPDAAPAAGGACVADAEHCCMADGRLVKPGGCQPSYPDHVQPATERNADGTCKAIPCYKKCLPVDARIATPGGEVVVSALRVGDEVWTVDARGQRVAAPVAKVASVPAPRHAIVVVRLDDGRVLRASAGHPTADGRLVGDLAAGDAIDGARVTSTAAEAYQGGRTWDLRPAGETGVYWADGVRIGTTVAP